MKTTFLILALFFTVHLFAQDVIVMNNSKRVVAVVLEVGVSDVKYVKYDNPNGPTYLVPKTDIKYIEYSNGHIDTFDEEKKNVAQTPQKTKDNYEKEYKNILRFKPLATVVSLLASGLGEIDLQYVRYVHPKIGIPVEVDFAFGGGAFGTALMSGIEAVPVTHRQKSGLFLNLLVGGLYISNGRDNGLGFCGASHIGYQLCTRKGFVFTPAIGAKFDSFSGFNLSLMLDIGFGF